MNTSENLELAFSKYQQEMQNNARLLDTKKSELKHIMEESVAFTAENKKQKMEMEARERKIRDNEVKKRKLESEIKQLEGKQLKDHTELSRMEMQNRARLVSHGVKLPPPHH